MKNAPVNIPESVLDKRQKEIAAFLASYNSMNEEFTKLVNDKYSFKGMIDENYNDKDEYRNRSRAASSSVRPRFPANRICL